MLNQPAKLEPLAFEDIEGFAEDDLHRAFSAFRTSARQMLQRSFSTKCLGADGKRLKALGESALGLGEVEARRARQFFEENFQPHRIVSQETGLLTGYFEPEVDAARAPDERFRYPLYERPDDLIDLRDHNRPAHIDASYRFGKQATDGIGFFSDRRAIDAGALNGRGLEIAWLADRVDQFFIHVQGSSRLRFADGTGTRLTYAAKSGHPYTSLGKILCERLDASPEEMTADRLAIWMREHPEKLDELLANNRSYIFFREVEEQPDDEGPIGAAGCPLVSGRSLAVDRTLHTFGTPVWVATRQPFVNSAESLRRLMVAHDTGSAITGSARGDIFVGSGAEAGLVAGKIRHEMEMITLLPREKS